MARSSVTSADTVRAELVQAATEFFERWQRAWIRSEGDRLSAERKRGVDVASETARRRPLVHCHGLRGQLNSPYTSASLPPNYVAISSLSSAFGVCPTWIIGDSLGVVDEAGLIDAGIAPESRPAIRTARAALIEQFRKASESLPADAFFVGQHVRFLLDQGLPDSALHAAASCESDAWWCAALEGYVHATQSRVSLAERSFDRARSAMPLSLRCAWDDLSPLLGTVDSMRLEYTGCDASVLLAERWWWLADPLYADSINERRVAHDARTVHVALLSSIPVDGRRRWTADYGRDALERLLLRYGWPTRSVWLGKQEDNGHDNWMRAQGSELQSPYTTYEFSRDRVATDPIADALGDPFALGDTAWQLNAPAIPASRREWWPHTHFRRARSLAQLPRGQLALFRRADSTKLAMATMLVDTPDQAPAHAPTSPARITLISSAAPESYVPVVETSYAGRSGPMVLIGALAASPTLLSLEVQGDSTHGDVRTRLGVTPPPTLRDLQPDEIALSDPVFLSPAAQRVLETSSDSLLRQRMLGSLDISVSSAPRVDVFWESYGVRREDSASVSVQVERQERLGMFRRLAVAMRVRDDPNATITVKWRDAPLGAAREASASAQEGRIEDIAGVPVHARAVTVDLSRLSTGPYTLTLEVERRDGAVARSSRRFVLTP